MSSRDRFDKFTERARKVLQYAQEESQHLQHPYIGTEHLLLGLIREGEGVAAKVLSNLGVELIKVRSAVEFIISRGDRIVLGEFGLTPRAKKVIELAVDEARRLNHHYIGTEHLLLGLVREGEGIAAGVLESMGVNLERLRGETIRVLNYASTAKETTPEAEQESSTIASSPEYTTPNGSHIASEKRNLDKFTASSRRALTFAQEEAQELQHNYIGTEHLLLGLLRLPDTLAAEVLKQYGVDLVLAREAVTFIIGRGDHIILGEIGLTPRAKKVIELAVDEAHSLGDSLISTEHILLGLVSEGQGIAAGVIESLHANLATIRQETLRRLQEQANS